LIFTDENYSLKDSWKPNESDGKSEVSEFSGSSEVSESSGSSEETKSETKEEEVFFRSY
jgi:hypothetical protein